MEKPRAPARNQENVYQRIDPFDDFAKQVDENGERRAPTPEERERMDGNLVRLGKIFESSGLHWHLDGALNVSLRKGEYIGVHKDMDISVEENQLHQLDEHLDKKGYGLFLSYEENPKQEGSRFVMERIGAADILLNRPGQIMIGAVDAEGKLQNDDPLNYPDIHVTKRNEAGKPVGWGKVELPEKWFEEYPAEFKDTVINLSHPAKVAYFKLHGTRDYDLTDLKALAETGRLSDTDLADIEQTIRAEGLLRRTIENVRTDRQKKFEQLKAWVTESREVKESKPFPTREEVLEAMGRFAEGCRIEREVSDERGLALLEARALGEKPGEVTEYRYHRDSDSTDSAPSVIYKTQYEDGVPVAGETMARYNKQTGGWDIAEGSPTKQELKVAEPSKETAGSVKVLLDNLEKSGFAPDFKGQEALQRKELLISIAEHLPTIALRMLQKLQQLSREQNLETGKLGFFVVGGRVRATPIKDNTDFDFAISTERPLYGHIPSPQYVALAKALYAEAESAFADQGIPYEKGIFETKGIGTQTSAQLEQREGTLKICEL